MDIQAYLIMIFIGLAAGMLSGLVGVGGGIILVPALVYFLNYNQQQAQGTSLGVLTVPVTIIAFMVYYNHCKELNTPIDLKVIAVVALGFLYGSNFGSKKAVQINQDLLRKLFALILFYTGIKMLHWDTMAFQWLKNKFS